MTTPTIYIRTEKEAIERYLRGITLRLNKDGFKETEGSNERRFQRDGDAQPLVTLEALTGDGKASVLMTVRDHGQTVQGDQRYFMRSLLADMMEYHDLVDRRASIEHLPPQGHSTYQYVLTPNTTEKRTSGLL